MSDYAHLGNVERVTREVAIFRLIYFLSTLFYFFIFCIRNKAVHEKAVSFYSYFESEIHKGAAGNCDWE